MQKIWVLWRRGYRNKAKVWCFLRSNLNNKRPISPGWTWPSSTWLRARRPNPVLQRKTQVFHIFDQAQLDFWPPQRCGSQSHRSAVCHRPRITANCPTPWSWGGTPTAARPCSHLSQRTLDSMVGHTENTVFHRVNLHMCSDMDEQRTNSIKKINKCIISNLNGGDSGNTSLILVQLSWVYWLMNYELPLCTWNVVCRVFLIMSKKKRRRRGKFFGLTRNVHILPAHFHKFNPFNSHSG